jgi:SulP family sulfate permease
VLAAVVIHAVSGLADHAELRRYVRITRGIVPALTALGGVLAFGVLPGMLLAVIVNLILLMKRMGTPGCSVLGRLPGTRTYLDVEQYPEAERIPGLLLFRLDDDYLARHAAARTSAAV